MQRAFMNDSSGEELIVEPRDVLRAQKFSESEKRRRRAGRASDGVVDEVFEQRLHVRSIEILVGEQRTHVDEGERSVVLAGERVQFSEER